MFEAFIILAGIYFLAPAVLYARLVILSLIHKDKIPDLFTDPDYSDKGSKTKILLALAYIILVPVYIYISKVKIGSMIFMILGVIGAIISILLYIPKKPKE